VLSEQIGRLPDPPEFGRDPLQVPDKCATFDLGLRDAGRQVLTAGSGWGDPLLRPTAAIAADIERGSVTRQAVPHIYGVVFRGDGEIDESATAERRRSLRAERLGRDDVPEIGDATRKAAVTARNGSLVCGFCEAELGQTDHADSGHGLANAHVRRSPLAERLDEWMVPIRPSRSVTFELVEHCCPGCGTLLEVDVELAQRE
jgi:N-methylhydantoinase B